MYTKLPIVLVTSAVLLFAAVSSAYPVFAQFDITTEQNPQDQQAVITVKLATNNTVVIPPNGTIIEVPGNVTVIDNTTVVVTPDNSTITELPGNVTVISPPEPVPCECPAANETAASAEGIEPVIVTPAPGQTVTIENATIVTSNETGVIVEGEGNATQPVPEPTPVPPVENQTGGGGGGNETLPVEPEPAPPTDNQTGNGGGDGGGEGNDTGLSPTSFRPETNPWLNLASAS